MEDGKEVPSPIFLPHDDNSILKDSIRSCIKDDSNGDGGDMNMTTSYQLPTELSLCFLGTSAGMPTKHRNTSATLLKLGGTSILVDAGEGVQRQLQFVLGSHKLRQLQRIFITHLHGDHIYGLSGLILGIHNQARTQLLQQVEKTKKKKTTTRRQHEILEDPSDGIPNTLQIYGPPGLYHYIASSLLLSCTKLTCLKIQVFELVGGRVKRISSSSSTPSIQQQTNTTQQQRLRDPFGNNISSDEYPEYHNHFLERHSIVAENGIWTIADKPPSLTREMIQKGKGYHHQYQGSSHNSTSSSSIQRLDRLTIRAAEVDHLPGIATFGYVVEEDEPPRNIDAAKAKALGVSPRNKQYELLKHGFSVLPDLLLDKEYDELATMEKEGAASSTSTSEWMQLVHPEQVLKPQFKRARKVAIVGDNRNWTRQMIDIARDADVLVHEATLVEEDYIVRRWSFCFYLLVFDYVLPDSLFFNCHIFFVPTIERPFDGRHGRSSKRRLQCRLAGPKSH